MLNLKKNLSARITTLQSVPTVLALFVSLAGSFQGQSQVTVKVDATKNWQGYMNWYSTNDAYVAGGAWGIADLRAAFVPPAPNASVVVLRVNTNTYNTGGYWNLADGTPNKHLEANLYVDVGTSFAGNDVNFVGTVQTNNLPAGWTCQAVIKEFAGGYVYLGDTRDSIVGGNSFSVTRTIAPGHICQYGFLTYGPNTAPGSADSLTGASIFVDNSDPSITGQPANQRVLVGGTATFTVTAVGASGLSYHWKRYGTNLVNGGNISGATSATLTISNAQLADATTYTATVTDTAGSLDAQPAKLRVLTAAQFANALDNPSFEFDVVDPAIIPDPWVTFSGSALQNTNDTYAFTPGANVKTIEGTNAAQVYNAGEYNGFYQDVPATPGQIFTGDGWFYQSSLDPLLAPTDVAFIEVQFRHGNDNPIAIYQSFGVTNAPELLDTWLFLRATNGVAAGYAQTSTTNSYYLTAPAGTDHVRYQVTLHYVGGGPGSVYVDSMSLMKKIPVVVSVSKVGANINLSFLTQGATSYQVVYKDNLTDSSWTPVGSLISGDGSTMSAQFPVTLG
jgi:hypothetical protein